MISQFEAAGFISCADDPNDRPDVVVAAFDPTLTYSRLCRCAWWASHKEIPYVATNPDWVCPTDEPTILVDCGSLCACIAAACGRKPDTIIGKPSPDILLGIMEKNGVTPAQAAMVGDRLYTDVKSGLNAGACGVLVLTGETTLETALASVPEDRATIICRDIAQFGALLEEVRK
jgi:NagD protein